MHLMRLIGVADVVCGLLLLLLLLLLLWAVGCGLCVIRCHDGVMNGGESCVDGGSVCGVGCGTGDACLVAQDCASSVCSGGMCVAGSCNDRVRNGLESCIDGGARSSCGLCSTGGQCVDGRDCVSGVCVSGRYDGSHASMMCECVWLVCVVS